MVPSLRLAAAEGVRADPAAARARRVSRRGRAAVPPGPRFPTLLFSCLQLKRQGAPGVVVSAVPTRHEGSPGGCCGGARRL